MLLAGEADLKRNLLVISIALFMLSSGMSMITPILPLFIKNLGLYDAGQAAKWSGLIQGVQFLTGALLSPVWGLAGDRYGRKSMMMRAFFGMAVTTALVGVAQSPFQILLIRFAHGCLGGAVSAAVALVSTITPEGSMAYTLGILHTAQMAGTIGGPFMGGLLADAFGFRICFFITGIIIFACGLLVTFLVREHFTTPEKKNQFSIADNFRVFFGSRQLLFIAGAILLIQMGQLGQNPILPLFIESIYPSKVMISTIVGSVFALSGLFAAITATFWGRRADCMGFRPTLLISISATGACLLLYAAANSLWQVYVIRILLGLFMAGTVPVLQSLIALNTERARRGSMYGTVAVANWIGNAAGPVLSGFTARFLGMRPAFAFLSFIRFCALAAVWIGVAEKRKPAPVEAGEENVEEKAAPLKAKEPDAEG